jgi:1-acyl-sn-glycerol-3-phosphate acyltransferase
VVGKENIPKSGGVIFAGNHLSFIDSVFLPVVLDRPIYFLAKSDYFRGTGIKGFFTRKFFNGTGMLPIDRSGGKASEASLNTGLAVLAKGEQLGIYPEGTRSPDGRMYRGRRRVTPSRGSIASASCLVNRSTFPGSTASRETGLYSGPSPTRSCMSSESSAARNTSTSTPHRSKRKPVSAEFVWCAAAPAAHPLRAPSAVAALRAPIG